MTHLGTRFIAFSQVAIGSIGIATMAIAAPLSAAPQEKPAPEPTAEKQQVPPDNSKKNKRDRDDKHLTPGDQGNSAADIKMTQDIRKEINQAKGITTNGKNIKIITIDGMVTLRGPVATAEQKQLIHDIAVKIAGPTKVHDQLEVKTSKTRS